MDITDLILLAISASTFVLGLGVALIRKDIDELKELIDEKL